MTRRCPLWIVLLGAALSLTGMARTPLPAQDGLKFIRVARQFQTEPWAGVIRGSDQHPLYPGCIALIQPLASRVVGQGPDSWRIAAQGVSALAGLLLLLPLFALTRALFDEPTAILAALLFVLLPEPAGITHETLSDALALLAFMFALQLGEYALRTNGLAAAIGCGVVAGIGYWTRPEVAVVPIVVVITAGLRYAVDRYRRMDLPTQAQHPLVRFAALGVTFLFVVGMYAMVKGEVSEKLALRRT
ncbi:MAG: glycosyltransferase family 39 protein, partial [Isosphaeraceae bacterium]